MQVGWGKKKKAGAYQWSNKKAGKKVICKAREQGMRITDDPKCETLQDSTKKGRREKKVVWLKKKTGMAQGALKKKLTYL